MIQRLLALQALCLASVAVPSRAAAVLGTEPGSEVKYEGTTFRCLDGSGEPLPAASVNDEFCDCADGSDEPGTGACAGQDKTLFFCHNKGSVPRRIYASRVGDGVCDCCDGSDEASLAKRQPSSKCKDVCAEEGAQKATETKEKVDMLRRALQRQDEIRKEGDVTRAKLQADVDTLTGETSALERAVKATKVAADAQRAEEAAAKAAKEAAEAAEKKAEQAAQLAKLIQEGLVKEGCMWRQTGGCAADGAKEPDKDQPCAEMTDGKVVDGTSGFCDCDGDGEKGEKEPGFTCDRAGGTSGQRKCLDECEKAGRAPAPEEAVEAEAPAQEQKSEAEVPAEEEKKAEVSQYSKWMDGAADMMADKEKVEEEKETAGEEKKAEASEYSKWMDGAADTAGAAGGESEAEAEHDDGASEGGDEEGHPEEPAEPVEGKEETAVEKEKAAERALSEHESKITKASSDLDNLKPEHMGYANLHGKLLERHIGEWNYKINFFGTAHQDHTRLGTWKGFTGARSAEFENGDMCWGGPARKLIISFICGEQEEILDLFEPSRCVYEATVKHPGACTLADLEVLEQGKVVYGPRDEL